MKEKISLSSRNPLHWILFIASLIQSTYISLIFNVTIPSTPGSNKCSPNLRFVSERCAFSTLCKSSLCHPPPCNETDNILWRAGLHFMGFLINCIVFYDFLLTFVFSDSYNLLSILFQTSSIYLLITYGFYINRLVNEIFVYRTLRLPHTWVLWSADETAVCLQRTSHPWWQTTLPAAEGLLQRCADGSHQ